MSKSMLTNEEVGALVEAAREGRLPEGDGGQRGRARKMRTVDFSRPTKFSAEHQRRIGRSLTLFAQTAGSRLSAELRVPVEVDMIGVSQLRWSSVQSEVPPSSLAMSIESRPIPSAMLMCAEQSFLLCAIDCLLGGAPDRVPPPRRFTDIDWTLSERVLTSLLVQLSAAWQELTGLDLVPTSLELFNDVQPIASVSEPTVLAALEVRMGALSSTVTVVIPYTAIAPVADRLTRQEGPELEPDARLEAAIHRAVGHAPVQLRVEVGGLELSMDEVLSLRAGAVLHLGGHAERGVSVFAGDTFVGRARPGRSGRRRALLMLDEERP
jgi:flagellar motor switch protein FliM